MRAKRLVTACVAGAAALGVLPLASAAPGALDLSFGDGGRVLADFGRSEHLSALALGHDGSIVAAGLSISRDGGADLALLLLRAGGLPDARFGANGRVVTDLGGFDFASDVVAHRGGFVIAGASGNSPLLARYLESGELDRGFASGGTFRGSFGRTAEFKRVFTLGDGKLLAVGALHDPDAFLIVRFEPDGTLDRTFGTTGAVITKTGAVAADAARGPRGELVVAGTWVHPDKRRPTDNLPITSIVARYGSGGRLDRSFGRDGIVRRDLRRRGRCCVVEALAVDTRRRVLVGGYQMRGGAAVARLRANGTIDASFGRGGTTRVEAATSVGALTLDRAGRIVAALRQARRGSAFDLAAARILTGGALDPRFGARGLAFADFRFFDDAWALAVQRDGKIVVGGYSGGALFSPEADNDFAIARYAAR